MTLGVRTAGFAGQNRDFALLGLEAWREPERALESLADLDANGVFVYGNGTRWEVRVAGMDARRADSFRRPIRNDILMRGDTHDDHDLDLALRLGVHALTDTGYADIEDRLAAALTAERVEALFRGGDVRDAIHGALASLEAPERTASTERDDSGTSWRGGALNQDAGRHLVPRIRAILSGQAGLVIRGEIYPEASSNIPTLLALNDSVAEWTEIGPKPTVDRSKDSQDGHPKALMAMLVLVGTAIVILIFLIRFLLQ